MLRSDKPICPHPYRTFSDVISYCIVFSVYLNSSEMRFLLSFLRQYPVIKCIKFDFCFFTHFYLHSFFKSYQSCVHIFGLLFQDFSLQYKYLPLFGPIFHNYSHMPFELTKALNTHLILTIFLEIISSYMHFKMCLTESNPLWPLFKKNYLSSLHSSLKIIITLESSIHTWTILENLVLIIAP